MWWIILLVLALVVGFGLFIMLKVDGPNRKEAMGITLEGAPFSGLKDGTYIGRWKGNTSSIRDTQIEVRVKDGNVSDLRVLKGAIDKNGQLVKLKGHTVQELLHTAVEQKSLQVDVISGATITSKTHLKALEDALGQAKQ